MDEVDILIEIADQYGESLTRQEASKIVSNNFNGDYRSAIKDITAQYNDPMSDEDLDKVYSRYLKKKDGSPDFSNLWAPPSQPSEPPSDAPGKPTPETGGVDGGITSSPGDLAAVEQFFETRKDQLVETSPGVFQKQEDIAPQESLSTPEQRMSQSPERLASSMVKFFAGTNPSQIVTPGGGVTTFDQEQEQSIKENAEAARVAAMDQAFELDERIQENDPQLTGDIREAWAEMKKGNIGAAGEFMFETLYSLGESAALNFATAGTGLMAQGIGDTYGDAVRQRMEEGETLEEAMQHEEDKLSSVVAGAVIGGLERIGLNKVFGKFGTSKIKNEFARRIADAVTTGMVEGSTEVAQGLAQEVGAKIASDKQELVNNLTNVEWWADKLATEGAMGLLGGGVAGGSRPAPGNQYTRDDKTPRTESDTEGGVEQDVQGPPATQEGSEETQIGPQPDQGGSGRPVPSEPAPEQGVKVNLKSIKPKSKEDVKVAMEQIFNLEEDKAEASAAIIDQGMNWISSRTNKSKDQVYEDYFKEIKKLSPKEEQRVQEEIKYQVDNFNGSDYQKKKTGKAFAKFFSDISQGKKGFSDVPYRPFIDITNDRRAGEFVEEYVKHRGKFDDHIAKSIPGFKEVQVITGSAIAETFEDGGEVLDIGGSENSWAKTISAITDGNVKTTTLDPNPDMKRFSSRISDVPGNQYVDQAFMQGWTEDDGTVVQSHRPEKKYDLVHEAMTFQFIGNNRTDQVAFIKENYLKDDGVLMTEEKLFTDNWDQNEALKDRYKSEYYTQEEMAKKKQDILQGRGDQAEGMNSNMVTQENFEQILNDNFEFVGQYWDNGNFKGYIATDNKAKFDELMGNIGNIPSFEEAFPEWLGSKKYAQRGVRKPSAKAAVKIGSAGEAIMYALTDPNVSSPVHELAHIFEAFLSDQDRSAVLEWTGQSSWNTDTSEMFARGFEKYLSEGNAPNTKLKEIFESFKEWLRDIYNGVIEYKGQPVELNDRMRDLFDQIMIANPSDGTVETKGNRIREALSLHANLKGKDLDSKVAEIEEALNQAREAGMPVEQIEADLIAELEAATDSEVSGEGRVLFQIDPRLSKEIGKVPLSDSITQSPKTESAIDDNMDKLNKWFEDHPAPFKDEDSYYEAFKKVFNYKGFVPLAPKHVIEMANSKDAVLESIKRVSPSQRKLAEEGLTAAKEVGKLYEDGKMNPVDTSNFFLWSILSIGVSPYVQESAFLRLLDAGMGAHIDKAVRGEFTKEDAKNAKSITVALKNTPGAGSTANANRFIDNFLLKGAEVISDGEYKGMTRLQALHSIFEDRKTPTYQLRRKWYKYFRGMQFNNKIFDFTLLVTGRDDVLVIDRVRVRDFWGNKEVFNAVGTENIYDSKSLTVPGTKAEGAGFSKILSDLSGIIYNEAIGKSIEENVRQAYKDIGVTENPSVGRYHWETWVAASNQEVSHGSLSAITQIKETGEMQSAGIREGKYGNWAFNFAFNYNKEDGFHYSFVDENNQEYILDADGYRGVYDEISRQKVSKSIPENERFIEYKQTQPVDPKKPWYEFDGVDKEKYFEFIRSKAKDVRSAPYESVDLPSLKYEINDPEVTFALAGDFSSAMASAIAKRGDDALQVDVVSEEDAQSIIDDGGRLLLSKNKDFGAYIKSDGYMGGLFKDPDSPAEYVGKRLQEIRVNMGGKYFDAYGVHPKTKKGTRLEKLYIGNGWVPVARLPFDPEFAPKGWENSTLKHKPDVVFFKYNPEQAAKAKVGQGIEVSSWDDGSRITLDETNNDTKLVPPGESVKNNVLFQDGDSPGKRPSVDEIMAKVMQKHISEQNLDPDRIKELKEKYQVEPKEGIRRASARWLSDPSVRDELKERLPRDGVVYVRQLNDVNMREAKAIVDEIGLDQAASIVAQEGENRAADAVTVFIARELFDRYQAIINNPSISSDERNKTMDDVLNLQERIAKLGTRAGQTVQAFSRLYATAPSLISRTIQRSIENKRQDKLDTHKDEISAVKEILKIADKDAIRGLLADPEIRKVLGAFSKKEPKVRSSAAKKKIQSTRSEIRSNLSNLSEGLRSGSIKFQGDEAVYADFVDELVGLYDTGMMLSDAIESLIPKYAQEVGFDPDRVRSRFKKEIAEERKSYTSTVERLIQTEGFDVLGLVREYYSGARDPKDTLAKMIQRQYPDLTDTEVERFKNAIQGVFDKHRDRELKKYRKRQIKNVRPRKQFHEKVIDAGQLGAITDEQYREMLAESFELPGMTREMATKLQEFVNRANKLPEGEMRGRVIQEMIDYAEYRNGVKLLDGAFAIFYSHMLSGFTTQAINIYANSAELLGEAYVTSLQELFKTKSPVNAWKRVGFVLNGMLRGAKRGFMRGANVVTTGFRPSPNKFDYDGTRRETYGRSHATEKMLWGYLPYKYVFRLMSGADQFFKDSLYEMRSHHLALSEAIKQGKNVPTKKMLEKAKFELGRDTKEVNEARLQAMEDVKSYINDQISQGNMDRSVLSGIDGPKTLKGSLKRLYHRRMFEIIEQGRSQQMQEEAQIFADRGTFTNRPEGVMGLFAESVNGLLKNLAGLRLFIPFVNIVGNVANRQLDWTPYGVLRAAKGGVGVGLSGKWEDNKTWKKYTPEERQAELIKGLTGSALMMTLWALAFSDEDEPIIEITANGTGDYRKNYQLEGTGWREYSFRIKGSDTWFQYRNTPLAIVFASIGSVRDAVKYQGVSKEDSYAMATYAATATMKHMKEQSFMQSISDLVSTSDIDFRNEEELYRRIEKILKKNARTMAVPNFASQLSKAVKDYQDLPMKSADQDGWMSYVWRDFYYSDSSENVYDALGNPVSPEILHRLLPLNAQGEREYSEEDKKIFDAIAQTGAYLTPPRKTTVVYDEEIDDFREINDDEYRDYTVRSSQIFKEMILEEWDDFSAVLELYGPEEGKDYIYAVQSAARSEAIEELFKPN